jgi:spore coat protein U-like protein
MHKDVFLYTIINHGINTGGDVCMAYQYFKKLAFFAFTLSFALEIHGQVTAPMNVTATVQNVCVIQSVVDTDFGIISGIFTTDLDVSNGSVTVLCTNGASYDIGLDNGNNFLVTRRMESAGTFIGYELYQEMTFTTPWGDIGTGTELAGLTGTGAPQSYTVYARIPMGQPPVGAGTYSDVVTVTVDF